MQNMSDKKESSTKYINCLVKNSQQWSHKQENSEEYAFNYKRISYIYSRNNNSIDQSVSC